MDHQGSPAMTDAVRFQLASELLSTGEAADASNVSPLFYLIRNNISIAFALLQLVQSSLRLNQPTDEQALVKAESAYAKSVQYVAQLPKEERTSALFDLGRLRTALDEFRSPENKTETRIIDSRS
jgi:hypothetical protein